MDRRGSLAQAPMEEEEVAADTAAAVERSRASLLQRAGIPHDEILAEFGLPVSRSAGYQDNQ